MEYTAGEIYQERCNVAWGALNIGIVKANFMDSILIEYYLWEIEDSEYSKYHWRIGQRVIRENKEGIIIKRYSKNAYIIGDTHLGPYPELYDIKFNNNTICVGVFYYGFEIIK